MPVYLYDGHGFPPPEAAETQPNGLLAVSAGLTAADLLVAYPAGIFPWSNPDEPVLWWSPDPRMVLFPDKIHVTRSLKKTIRNNPYTVRIDTSFEAVMRACAAPSPVRPTTWISEAYITAYTELHALGLAHSVEIWINNGLVGGLYGVSLGRVFYGESMFSVVRDASKIALAFLAFFLKYHRFAVIDCQVSNPHLISLGAEEISRSAFQALLNRYVPVAGEVAWTVTPAWMEAFRSMRWMTEGNKDFPSAYG